jgi:hypothetical protein
VSQFTYRGCTTDSRRVRLCIEKDGSFVEACRGFCCDRGGRLLGCGGQPRRGSIRLANSLSSMMPPGSSQLDLGERPSAHDLAAAAARYASAARRAGSAWPRIIRRRVISRRVIGRHWIIWRRPVTPVVEGRRPREHSERRGDDCRGGNDYGARRADRPGQWRRRVGGIVLRIGRRERQSGEPGERYRNRNSADTHGVSQLRPCAPRLANVVRRAKARSLPGLAGVG